MRFCSQCGNPCTEADSRCPRCGVELTAGDQLETGFPTQPQGTPGQQNPAPPSPPQAPSPGGSAPQVPGQYAAGQTSAGIPVPPQGHPAAYGHASPLRPYPAIPNAAKNPTAFFCENILGLIPTALFLLVLLLLLFIASPENLPRVITNSFRILATMLPMAVAVALTHRAKGGVDLALPAYMTLGALLYAVTGSGIAAVVVVLLLGAVNGLLVAVCRMSSIATLAVYGILQGIVSLASGGQAIKLDGMGNRTGIFVVLAFIILALGVAYVVLTSGKGEDAHRYKNTLFSFLAFPLASAFAGISGIMFVHRLSAFVPGMGNWDSMIPPIVIVWAALRCSKLTENRFVPVLAACLVYGVLNMFRLALTVIAVSSYSQMLLEGIIAVLFVGMAALVHFLSGYFRKKITG